MEKTEKNEPHPHSGGERMKRVRMAGSSGEENVRFYEWIPSFFKSFSHEGWGIPFQFSATASS